jgi:hypothetical protein
VTSTVRTATTTLSSTPKHQRHRYKSRAKMRGSTRGMHPSCAVPRPSSRHHRMIKDERIQQEEMRSIFDVKEAPNKLG